MGFAFSQEMPLTKLSFSYRSDCYRLFWSHLSQCWPSEGLSKGHQRVAFTQKKMMERMAKVLLSFFSLILEAELLLFVVSNQSCHFFLGQKKTKIERGSISFVGHFFFQRESTANSFQLKHVFVLLGKRHCRTHSSHRNVILSTMEAAYSFDVAQRTFRCTFL